MAERNRLKLGARDMRAGDEPNFHVMVRCTDPDTREVAGVALSGGARSVQTAIVPLSKLPEFAAMDAVQRVSAPRLMRPLLDCAAPLVGADDYKLRRKVGGKGVFIGIVDTGIDVNRPAFGGRVHAIWDQQIAGPGPGKGFSKLGRVLTGNQMAISADMDGHGTHVAGITAGAGPVYVGIAPDADYLIVKTNFQNTAIVEAVRWIFAQAALLNRPCVVNLSLGGHFDSHDGEDDASVAISDECGPGRLVVAAAGNEGKAAIHARQEVTAGQQAAFEIEVNARTSLSPAPALLINGWYDGAGQCEIRVISSSGAQTPWQGLLSADPAVASYALNDDTLLISTPDGVAPNGDRQFVVQIQNSGVGVQGGLWQVQVRRLQGRPGDVHVWLLLDPDHADSARLTSPHFTHLIGSPGAAKKVVTVASYTSRNSWTMQDGTAAAVGLAPDTISDFSSPGPLRGGGRKPDLSAPGAMIASCMSGDSVDGVLPSNLVGADYCMMAGTSMAAPVVSGLLALLLEERPQTGPALAKRWLKKKSAIPGYKMGAHDIKWGYGLIKV